MKRLVLMGSRVGVLFLFSMGVTFSVAAGPIEFCLGMFRAPNPRPVADGLREYPSLSQIIARVQNRSYWDMSGVRRIPIESLSTWERQSPLDFPGMNNAGIYMGQSLGQTMIFKRYRDPSTLSEKLARQQIEEVAFAEMSSDLLIGPYFHGAVVENGRIVGIVTDYVDGPMNKFYDGPRSSPAAAYTDRKRIEAFIEAIGINTHADFQGRYDNNNRFWVIDTATWTWDTMLPENLLRAHIENLWNDRRNMTSSSSNVTEN